MAWTQRFGDSFTEASDTNLSAHTPDTGSSWTRIVSASTEAQVDEATDTLHRPYYGGTVRNIYQANIAGTWADDQAAEGIRTIAPNLAAAAPSVRVQSDGASSADGYAVGYNAGTTSTKLFRIDSGVYTELESVSGTIADEVIRIEAIGTSIKMYKGGVLLGSGVTDATYQTGGTPGLVTFKSVSGTAFDNFAAFDEAAAGGDPEAGLISGKLLRGGLLIGGGMLGR